MELNEESTKTVSKRIKLQPKMWKREEVLVLLDVYESTLTQSNDNSTENENELWPTVSEKLYEQGIEASPAHCQIKRILDTIASIEENALKLEEHDGEDLYKEERLDEETEMEETIIEEQQQEHTTISFTDERVSNTPSEGMEDGIQQLIARLCSKIDTLTELQHRQEARLEEVYQIQRINEGHLLEIKKQFSMG